MYERINYAFFCTFCLPFTPVCENSHEMLLEYMTMLFIFGLTTTHLERSRFSVQGKLAETLLSFMYIISRYICAYHSL